VGYKTKAVEYRTWLTPLARKFTIGNYTVRTFQNGNRT